MDEKDLVEGMREYISLLQKEGRYSSAKSYQDAMNSFIRYSGTDRIPYTYINKDTLRRYEAYLLEKGCMRNTVSTYIRRLRCIYNKAVENGDRFYKIKVYFITLDEKSGAEKKTAAQMLAQATTLKEAIAVLEDGMKGTLADYTIASVTETQLMDVFPFDANSIPGEKKSGEELIAEQKQQAEQRG